MPNEQRGAIYHHLKAPRAAAVAGILFAVLFSGSVGMMRIAIPSNPAEGGEWLQDNSKLVSLALGLLPLAGVAFLWFIGVVRDRLGSLEDQFLSSVFLGSGLLFLALTFISASLAGALLAVHAQQPDRLIDSAMYAFGRAASYQLSNVYAVKMAGVFMASLGTIWIRTRLLPRWLAFFTYVLALALLLSISSSLWVMMIFPAWVCAVSIYILVWNPGRSLTRLPDNSESVTSAPAIARSSRSEGPTVRS